MEISSKRVKTNLINLIFSFYRRYNMRAYFLRQIMLVPKLTYYTMRFTRKIIIVTANDSWFS